MNKWPPLRSRKTVNSILLFTFLFSLALCSYGAGTSRADEYDQQDAGNPLRVAAYLLFPVGVLADYCLMRPAFWIVQREPFATVFGYEYISRVGEEVKEDPIEERLETSDHR